MSEESQRRADEILRLRNQGMPFTAIGDRYGITRQRAHQIWQHALAAIPAEAVHEARAQQSERLDSLLVTANEVLIREHIHVSQGKVVLHDGVPVRDDGPTLAAIGMIVRIEERRARLLGLDAPTKSEVRTIGQIESEIADLEAKLAANDRADQPG